MEQDKEDKPNKENEIINDSKDKEKEKPGKTKTKEIDIFTNINNYLKNYLKDNKKISIFVSIVQLFKRKNYAEMEYTEIFTSLLNDFSKNKKKYKFTENRPLEKNIEQIINEFCEKIESELKSNKAIIIRNIDEKKMIQLDLNQVIEYFLEIERSKPPKRKYNKKKKKLNEENLENNKNNEKNDKKVEEKPEAIPEIFTKKLYNVSLSAPADIEFFDNVLQKAKVYINNIKQTDSELEDLNEKIQLINKKVSDINKNKKNYTNIKVLIRDCLFELNNIYKNMNTELEQVKKFSNVNIYEKALYEKPRKTLITQKQSFLKVLDKIKNHIVTLNQIEKVLSEEVREINDNADIINLLYFKIFGFPCDDLVNIYKDLEINLENINVDEILKKYLISTQLIIKEFKDAEEINKQLAHEDMVVDKEDFMRFDF